MSCDFCTGPGRPRHRYGSTIIVWGMSNTRNGAAYVRASRRRASVERAALEQRFLGDGRMLRRRMGTREWVCRGDGLEVGNGLDRADRLDGADGEEPWATL
jgi:hypothetical protein